MHPKVDLRTLVVGNLSPKVNVRKVRRFFEVCGKVRWVWLRKDNVGWCYVVFARKEDAQKALTTMNNKMLLGHKVWLNMVAAANKNENRTIYVLQEKKLSLDNSTVAQVRQNLESKYRDCGNVIEVFIPAHKIEDNKATAFVRFETQEGVENANRKNLSSRSMGRSRNFTGRLEYIHNTSEIETNSGFGGIYGFASEIGTAKSNWETPAAAHIVFSSSSDDEK